MHLQWLYSGDIVVQIVALQGEDASATVVEPMNEDKRTFWNTRARMSEHSGTDDFVLQKLEERELLRHIPFGSRVLDVGCGDGSLLALAAAELGCTGEGLDFSSEFVERCRRRHEKVGLTFHLGSMLDVDALVFGTFDVITTKRSLINLDSAEEQLQVLEKLLRLLKPGGVMLVLESTIEGLERLNTLRRGFDLPDMEAPWHNRYFQASELAEFAEHIDVASLSTSDFASTYYLLSRVVNAHLANMNGLEMHYNDPVNVMALDIPAYGNVGAPRLHIIEKVA